MVMYYLKSRDLKKIEGREFTLRIQKNSHGLWKRPLSPRDRSVVTVAALATCGCRARYALSVRRSTAIQPIIPERCPTFT
jgi:hypothetical protein